MLVNPGKPLLSLADDSEQSCDNPDGAKNGRPGLGPEQKRPPLDLRVAFQSDLENPRLADFVMEGPLSRGLDGLPLRRAIREGTVSDQRLQTKSPWIKGHRMSGIGAPQQWQTRLDGPRPLQLEMLGRLQKFSVPEILRHIDMPLRP